MTMTYQGDLLGEKVVYAPQYFDACVNAWVNLLGHDSGFIWDLYTKVPK